MYIRLVSFATLASCFLASSGGFSCTAAAEPFSAKTEGPPADTPTTQAIDERAKEILNKAASNLMAIGSIEFRAERDMEFTFPKVDPKLVKDLPSRAKDSYLFRCDGERWRVDESLGRSESYSFNGTMFQYLSTELSAFRESKHRMGTRPQVAFPHPINYAYLWVFPANGFLSWDELRDRKNWNAAAIRAKFVPEAKQENTSLVTVEVSRVATSGQTFLTSIDFDKEHGYSPAAWRSYLMPDRKSSTTVVVKRWADFDDGAGRRIWLPIEVNIKSATVSGAVCFVGHTLHVNQPIPEEDFTLPRSAAKHDLGPYGLDEKTADFFKTRGPLDERLATAKDDARRNHQRIIVIFGDPDVEASQRLFELREKDWRRPLYEYQQVPIGKNDLSAVEAFRKIYPKLANLHWPGLVVLDGAGKALDSLDVSLSSADSATESVKAQEFLQKNALEKPDAERLLAGAVAKAKEENKKVFLQETGIYCAPCRLLSRFFERHASVLDQNYIYLKIDPARSIHGPEVIKRLKTDGSVGIPWIAILDQDGQVVASELGYPSHEAKEIDEFVALFSKTAPRLTAEQLKDLRSDLEDNP
jgi:Thioredoxin-like